MSDIKWEFALTGGGTEDGINNPMIEHFEGNHNYHLAREIIQNSLDARLDKNVPVKVEYSLQMFSKHDFPGRDDLEEIFVKCIDYWDEDEKAQKILNNALIAIRQDRISVLKISDYNTWGLEGGDHDKKKPWYNLVKSRGSSSKSGGEGGSFGLGKGAPYAASVLRTVFYASKSHKDKLSRFIGVAEIVSHIKESGVMRGTGSFGGKYQSTITDLNVLKKLGEFWRRESGLDIYVMGYKDDKDWKVDLIKSILRNFWYAILNEDLVVVIEDEEINFENLPELMSFYFLDEPYKDYVEPKGNPLSYFETFVNGKPFEAKLPFLGNVKFYFRQIDEKLNYVAMMRKSHMVIYSKSFHFPVPFAGVFLCDDDDGNEELRKMEPPTHDKWDPARYPENGRKIMDELEEWIRKCLREMRVIRENEILEIPDLEKYLPFEEGEESGDGRGSSEYSGEKSDEETSKLIGADEIYKFSSKIDPYNVAVLNSAASGFGGLGKVMRKGKNKIKKSNAAPGGGSGKAKALTPEQIDSRIFSLSKKFQDQEYLIKIRSKIDGRCDLRLQAVGEEGSEKIKITSVKDPRGYNYKISNNCIKGFYLESDTEYDIKILMDSKLKCSLSLDAYEIQ